MKARNKRYLERSKSLAAIPACNDLKSFLLASLAASRSLVVKKDIISTLIGLETGRRNQQLRAH